MFERRFGDSGYGLCGPCLCGHPVCDHRADRKTGGWWAGNKSTASITIISTAVGGIRHFQTY